MATSKTQDRIPIASSKTHTHVIDQRTGVAYVRTDILDKKPHMLPAVWDHELGKAVIFTGQLAAPKQKKNSGAFSEIAEVDGPKLVRDVEKATGVRLNRSAQKELIDSTRMYLSTREMIDEQWPNTSKVKGSLKDISAASKTLLRLLENLDTDTRGLLLHFGITAAEYVNPDELNWFPNIDIQRTIDDLKTIMVAATEAEKQKPSCHKKPAVSYNAYLKAIIRIYNQVTLKKNIKTAKVGFVMDVLCSAGLSCGTAKQLEALRDRIKSLS